MSLGTPEGLPEPPQLQESDELQLSYLDLAKQFRDIFGRFIDEYGAIGYLHRKTRKDGIITASQHGFETADAEDNILLLEFFNQGLNSFNTVDIYRSILRKGADGSFTSMRYRISGDNQIVKHQSTISGVESVKDAWVLPNSAFVHPPEIDTVWVRDSFNNIIYGPGTFPDRTEPELTTMTTDVNECIDLLGQLGAGTLVFPRRQ